MLSKSLLFWQPPTDYLTLFLSKPSTKKILILLNYATWIFLFFISYLLIRQNINIFGQLLLAVIISEIVERLIKSKVFWTRPMFKRHHSTPIGLVDSWYRTGSFPSGHTIKAAYYFMFILQYHIFSPIIFLLIEVPLLLFRILVGFHYPIDMIGGILIGLAVWLITNSLQFPSDFNNIIKIIFDFVFFIK